MKSNYKPIGEYIRLVDERNIGLKVTTLLGLSISKEFIPSVANTIGSDMENYKIIRRNQFACSLMQVRRDKKIPVALLHDFKEAIISQAYPVFEVLDENVLLPEYLMMWFCRSEFDRESCFYAVGGVRGSLEWEDFCNMQLPITSLEKQKEIVAEYNTIVNRIKLNEQLNQKLEKTAQAIYKQWFVDFEFQDENGNTYKSSGGEMEYSDTLGTDIPLGWKHGTWKDIATHFTGFAFKGDCYTLDVGISVLRGENVTEQKLRWDTHKKWNQVLDERMSKCLLEPGDIVIGMDGSKVGKNWAVISKFHLPLVLAQRVACVRAKHNWAQPFLYYSMFYGDFPGYVDQIQTGTSVPHISGEQIMAFPVTIPAKDILKNFLNVVAKVLDREAQNNHEINKLVEFRDILLSQMAKQN